MDIENYENVLNKLKQISRIYTLELEINTIITISKDNINDKRVLLALNNSTSDNIIYNNIDYINQELNLDIKFKSNSFIESLVFDYDFKRNIIQIMNSKRNTKETIVIYSNIKKYINEKYKQYTIKGVLDKFDFLKKYNKNNFIKNKSFFIVRKRSDKVMAVMLNFRIKLLQSEDKFRNLCDIFEIKKEQVEEYFNKYSEKNIKFISFSDNLVNIYTN